VALALVAASVLLPQTTTSPVEARNLGFGYPFNFAYADMSFHAATPPNYYFNPWEDPADLAVERFALDWALVTLAFVVPVAGTRRLWAHGRAQLGL
jgi:hypothetical protein